MTVVSLCLLGHRAVLVGSLFKYLVPKQGHLRVQPEALTSNAGGGSYGSEKSLRLGIQRPRFEIQL